MPDERHGQHPKKHHKKTPRKVTAQQFKLVVLFREHALLQNKGHKKEHLKSTEPIQVRKKSTRTREIPDKDIHPKGTLITLQAVVTPRPITRVVGDKAVLTRAVIAGGQTRTPVATVDHRVRAVKRVG